MGKLKTAPTSLLQVKRKSNVVEVNLLQLKKAIFILKALNHKLRPQIVTLIAYNKQMTVTQLLAELNLEQSFASQQLAILRKANIVEAKRQGKCIYYSINIDGLKKIKTSIIQLLA